MNRIRMMACAAAVAGIAGVAFAAGPLMWSATLTGYQEVPALSNSAGGAFNAAISPDGTTVTWDLTFEATDVTQSHLHFGQAGVNGGVSVFLCSNLGNGPAGTQPCPVNGGTISGTFSAADVIGPAGQGIAAGELSELIAAIHVGAVYANVHTASQSWHISAHGPPGGAGPLSGTGRPFPATPPARARPPPGGRPSTRCRPAR